jgi:hypothetical protein
MNTLVYELYNRYSDINIKYNKYNSINSKLVLNIYFTGHTLYNESNSNPYYINICVYGLLGSVYMIIKLTNNHDILFVNHVLDNDQLYSIIDNTIILLYNKKDRIKSKNKIMYIIKKYLICH